MFLADQWQDYEVLDCGGGEKLERWGDVYLRRPDPQAIWPARDPSLWRKAQAHYHRSEKGGGSWEFFTKLPDRWVMNYKNLRFYVRPTGFKHTGLFPEQAANWDWMTDLAAGIGKQVQHAHLSPLLHAFGDEVWKLENELYGLAKACSEALSDDPLFFLINGYTTGFQASVLGNMIDMTVKPRFGGLITADEVCLPVTAGGVLPCGASGRWQRA